ncbi:MAG: hypothetical protein ACP5UV_00735 [Thermoplasmata archaeon]
MNKYISLITVILFFLAVAFPILLIQGSFQPISQDISMIGTAFFNVYIIPFELLSLIIVGSVIGLMYVARGD